MKILGIHISSQEGKSVHMEGMRVLQELESTACQFAGPGIAFINQREAVLSVLQTS